jgi:DNA polymerase III epsilon subunit-like protein|tara:strand:- start:1620 stop:2291 length:672 start_codon:yes stop_codon:yes gene_type:complete
MKVIIFDTETTGLPKRSKDNKSPSIYDTTSWPYIIQLSYILYDTEKHKIIIDHDHIIKIPNHCDLTEKSVEMHGITRAKSQKEGMNIVDAIELFNICLNAADIVVAHNISFDKQMMLVECIRYKITSLFKNKKRDQFFCTMRESVDLCKIPAICKKTQETYFKFPRLSELHQQLFDVDPQNTHNSFVDILICLRCYIMLTDNVDIFQTCSKFNRLYTKFCTHA